MAKKNRNNSNKNNNNSRNNAPANGNKTVTPAVSNETKTNDQEITMEKTYTAVEVEAMMVEVALKTQADLQIGGEDILDSYSAEATERRKNKTINKSEVALLKKEIAKAKLHLNDKRDLALDDCDNKIMALQIKQAHKMQLIQMKEAYKPQLKALKLDFESIIPAGAEEAGEWVGEKIAPAVKTVGSFFGSLKTRAGFKSK